MPRHVCVGCEIIFPPCKETSSKVSASLKGMKYPDLNVVLCRSPFTFIPSFSLPSLSSYCATDWNARCFLRAWPRRRGVTMFFDVVIADAHFLEQEGMFSPHFEAREPGRARPMETSPLHPISLPFKVISASLWDQIPMTLSIFCAERLTNFYSTDGK